MLTGRSMRSGASLSPDGRSIGASASCLDGLCAAVMAASLEVRPAAAYRPAFHALPIRK